MLFKNPKVLYALFALLIPIFIHLFKLRKFQKVAFTNVAFLEKIKIESRKSSNIKKWLVLLSRLALLAFLILAFARPYFPAISKKEKPEQYIYYLDNSFSMQAKGSNAPLLNEAIQQLLASVDKNQVFTLFTNNEVFKEVTINEIQNELLELNYTPEQLSPKQILLKAKSLSKNKKSTSLIAISDFQKKKNFDFSTLKEYTSIIQLQPQQLQNSSIDSLWIEEKENQKLLQIVCSSNQKSISSLAVKNGINLIGKATIDFSKQTKQLTSIPIAKNTSITGKVSLQSSDGLLFDNTRYFSINEAPKPKVLVIGDAFFQFLNKIYTKKEFNFNATQLDRVNYNTLSNQNIIILNEVTQFSNSLAQALLEFTKLGGTLCVIPSKEKNKNLNLFLEENYGLTIGEFQKNTKKVTQISYQHPLFKNVFHKTVENFQYPAIKGSFKLNSKNWILNFEDFLPFLVQKNNLFVFAAPLNDEISNFKKSPLIVPVFYNMAKQNSFNSAINFTIGASNSFNVPLQQNQDKVLTIKNSEDSFIPLQQVYDNRVKISTDELPKKAGNYDVLSKDKKLLSVSYNYDDSESKLIYENSLNTSKKYDTSISGFLNTEKANFETTELWKWFLIFAVLFLLVEIALLKFLK